MELDYTCEICGRKLARNQTLKRHIAEQHGDAPAMKKRCVPNVPLASPLKCTFCNQVFTSAASRKRHQNKVHSAMIGTPQVSTAIICNDCSGTESSGPVSFNNLTQYRNHLQDHHDIHVNKIGYKFNSSNEFMAWKDKIEADIGVNYSSRRGAQKYSYGMKTTYYCRRSGLQRVHGSDERRAAKSQGTCKLGHYCTSSMEVKTTHDDVVHLIYYPDHRDHDLDLPNMVHMNLTNSEREKIAGMIVKGMEYDKILHYVKGRSRGSRLSLLKKKDLQNIATEFGLITDHSPHSDDSTSDVFGHCEKKSDGESGFKARDIWPTDRLTYQDEAFLGSEVKDIPLSEISAEEQGLDMELHTTVSPSPIPSSLSFITVGASDPSISRPSTSRPSALSSEDIQIIPKATVYILVDNEGAIDGMYVNEEEKRKKAEEKKNDKLPKLKRIHLPNHIYLPDEDEDSEREEHFLPEKEEEDREQEEDLVLDDSSEYIFAVPGLL